MGRIVERIRGVDARRAALVLAMAALAAVAIYVGVQETQVGSRAEAGAAAAQEATSEATPQDSDEETGATDTAEPLTLSLSAPEICEVREPSEGWSHGLEWNEEEGVWEDLSADSWWYWDSVEALEVGWSAAGGDGAYLVTIGGETYEGASGSAWLRCAPEDELEAGWGDMAVTASVIDGSGAVAEAFARVQVLLAAPDGGLLVAGETYFIKGWHVTIPHEFDMMVGDYEETICAPAGDGEDAAPVCENAFSLGVQTERYYAWLSIGEQSGAEGGRQIWLTDEDAAEAMELHDEVHLAFDRLLASLERAPQEGGE